MLPRAAPGRRLRRLSGRWPRVQPEFSPLFKKRDMPGAIFLACVRAWACGVCQSDALTLLYTLVCVSLRALEINFWPQASLAAAAHADGLPCKALAPMAGLMDGADGEVVARSVSFSSRKG